MASNILTWDDTVPRRPSVDTDFGGAVKENHPTLPPDGVKMPKAEEFNQMSRQVVALARVAPMAIVYVTITAGVPAVSSVLAPGTNITVANFTVVDNAAGDTSLRWAASGVFPDRAGGAFASLVQDVDATITAVYTTESSLPAVRVRTRVATVLTDANFAVAIF